ncbi:subtilisin-like protease SBT1.3 [Nicotiana tomentosiformis]|uniref:subtilisin-like protease SBT1.3 n=1 Tax=Nicotiana tomentosiformis TaxID=4098 RepID=UPI00051AEC05|nr:subtilisin-like protease SBT1.3 [Nicotiana tomentosiformis]
MAALNFFIIFTSLVLPIASELLLSTYVVHVDTKTRPSHYLTQDEWYNSMVESVLENKMDSDSTSPRLFYSYDVVLQGFAARLTDQESEKLNKYPEVTRIFKDQFRIKLDTTRSPNFLGLNTGYGLWPKSNFGDDVIVGLVDTGIWPESESFKDNGIGPIPTRWKGKCVDGIAFNATRNCNRKLIGARNFVKGVENDYHHQSPRDQNGHGTHTASTAAGAEVYGANVFGFAKGKARGIASKARIAMYKACGSSSCAESDILAAIESAIKDGVDILSLSLGYDDDPFYENPVAIATFAAVKRNIFVVSSAGNLGPYPFSVHNTAPWVTTVGAGSLDRDFPIEINLSNNKTFVGSSLYPGRISGKSYPLVYIENCSRMTIDRSKVERKIVVCNTSKIEALRNGILIQKTGGVGLIQLNLATEGEGFRAMAYTLSSATLSYKEGIELLSYIKSNANPTARFVRRKGTVIGKKVRAPIVASFSSRGPNVVVPEVLKPDLIAPGLNILAAWPGDISPTRLKMDPRRVKFNINSGTSMACPHVAGVAALVRAVHPDWSPAAIKSALMTTSTAFDNAKLPIIKHEDMELATPVSIGSGHVNPESAIDPGLIYDTDTSDYINLLCSLNYTEKQMKLFTNESNPCSGFTGSPLDLNYPSLSVMFRPDSSVHFVKRTLTHVAVSKPEVYKVKIVNLNSEKVSLSIEPRKLMFNESSKKQSYMVKFESHYAFNSSRKIVEQMAFGSISWESDKHNVRSPFVVMWVQQNFNNSRLYK